MQRVLYEGEEYDVVFVDNEHGTLTLLSDEGEDFVVFATYCQTI